MADSHFLTVAQVARRLGCSVSLVQKWRRLGWLKATRLGTPEVGVYGYLPEDVDHFAAESWNRRRGRPPRTKQGDAALPLDPLAPSAGLRPAQRRAPPSEPPAEAPAPSEARRPSERSERGLRRFELGGRGGAVRAQRAGPPEVTAKRPLALWDADPRSARALVLARFRPEELNYALSLATAWANRYDTLALGEPATAESPQTILALWQNGRRASDPNT